MNGDGAVDGFVLVIAIVAAILLIRYLQGRARKHRAYMQAVAEFRWDPGMSPVEFEHHCADYLRQKGWNANTTKGSGDQGVDVLAVKAGVRVVLQCKKYSKPVGNKAVQEAHAALSFARAHRAAVVSNQGYTPGARQLAHSTGVLLLHFTDLSRADELFGVALERVLGAGEAPFMEEDDRTEVRCGRCPAVLRLPKGREGMVTCPSCSHRFRART